jgi:hypothetical protein
MTAVTPYENDLIATLRRENEQLRSQLGHANARVKRLQATLLDIRTHARGALRALEVVLHKTGQNGG